jgi:hypothetical protein
VLLVDGYSLVSGLISRATLSITCKDQPGGFAQITSVKEHDGKLHLGSLMEDAIGVLHVSFLMGA